MLGNLLDGRYQVLQILGGGGFGQTYIARDTHRPGYPKCVVKHLKPVTQNVEFLETARRLFTSEAEILERLGNHDQIPRLLAYFEEKQEFFLVQEFIEGHSLLAELLPGKSWTEEQAIQLLSQVLEILTFIHSHNVIHRDIKPENIIRRQIDGKLVLIDFGAVKQIQSQLLTAFGHMATTIAIGTPGYMSTEQGRGKPRPNSDIYSLGIICIQALTGLHPRQLEEDPETGEIVWQHLTNVSPGLATVLTKMVLHHFRERYQSATDVLQALQQSCSVINAQLTQAPYLTQPSPVSLSSQNTTLSKEQYSRLENILLEIVGPVARTLLRQVTASAPNNQALIDNLALHLPGNQQIELKKRATFLIEEPTSNSTSKQQNILPTPSQVLSESFVRQCERDLTDLIGPIAAFLVQKAIKTSPQISRTELVQTLAAHISDPQKAQQFQQRLLA
ncbi:serine/threonine protein kinase [Nostoc minutum NIES-26]|uniref:non-specific serine/threonine protein kinase n=1 Tax=Nostoc minutum NIES-26 TaxID=1844469 RepID=A0A367QPB5_9NOSO|nr:serine/threonine protein kinase [Nostoc minutum NIES-26]